MAALTTDDPRVSEAVVVWTGFGSAMMPLRDELLVQERFGDLALDLMPLVRTLEDAFYDSKAWQVAVDDLDMGRRAIAAFRVLHPEVSERAVDALAWCYTFDHR